MARSEDLLYGPIKWSVIHAATNATATALKAAAPLLQHYITGFSISAGGAVAAAVICQLLDDVTPIDQFEIPNAALAPLIHNYGRAFAITPGKAVSLVLPPLGTNIRGTVVLKGFSAQVP